MEKIILIVKRTKKIVREGKETRRNMRDTKRDEEKGSRRGRAAVTY